MSVDVDDLVSIDYVAKLLGITKPGAYRALRKGRLDFARPGKLGRNWRFSRTALDERFEATLKERATDAA